MPDPSETTPQAGESAAPQTPEAVTTPQAGAENAQAAVSSTDEESISLKKAKKLRQENQSLRERMQAAEDKARELEKAAMSEDERTRLERDEAVEKAKKLESRLPEVITHYAVELAAQKLGVVDSEVVAKLIDRSELKYDEDGLPTNVDKVIEALLEEKPFLRGPQSANGTATSTPPPTPSSGSVTNPASQGTPAVTRITSYADWQKSDKDQVFDAVRNGLYPKD